MTDQNLHKQSIKNGIDSLLAREALSDYYKEVEQNFFSFYEWSFVQSLLFKNIDTNNSDYEKILIGSELILLSAYLKDDILDKTAVRSHQESFYAKFGAGITCFVADAIFTKGLQTIYYEVSRLTGIDIATTVQNNIIEGYKRSATGQVLSCSKTIGDNNVVNNIQLIKLKTASIVEPLLTIPAFMYANELIPLYENLSENLSLAFQIHNDITDIIGDKSNIGKPLLEDLQNHQINIVLSHYLEKIDYRADDIIVNVWSNNTNINEESDIKNNIFLSLTDSDAIESSYDLYMDCLNNLLENIEKLRDDVKIQFIYLIEKSFF